MFAFKGPESNGVSGGIEVYEEEFAKTLESMGAMVEIYCGRDKDEKDLPSFERISNNITVRRFDSPFNFLPFSLLRMHKYYILKGRKNTDYIIENQSVIPLMTPLYKESILTIIHHLTGKDFIRKQGLVKGVIGILAERVILPFLYRKENILTVSNHSKKELVKVGFKEKQINIIPPIVRTDSSKFIPQINRENIISYIGRYTGRGGNKRIDDVIEIFPKIIEKIPTAKLIIGGSAKKENELKELTEKLNLSNNIEFHGFVSKEKKAEILAASKVFASPSYQEGFGITYIEAHSYGTPVVGYKIKDLDTVPPDSGIMVERDNRQALADAIILLLTDSAKWEKYSVGALNNSNRYAYETIQAEIKNYILNLIK